MDLQAGKDQRASGHQRDSWPEYSDRQQKTRKTSSKQIRLWDWQASYLSGSVEDVQNGLKWDCQVVWRRKRKMAERLTSVKVQLNTSLSDVGNCLAIVWFYYCDFIGLGKMNACWGLQSGNCPKIALNFPYTLEEKDKNCITWIISLIY